MRIWTFVAAGIGFAIASSSATAQFSFPAKQAPSNYRKIIEQAFKNSYDYRRGAIADMEISSPGMEAVLPIWAGDVATVCVRYRKLGGLFPASKNAKKALRQYAFNPDGTAQDLGEVDQILAFRKRCSEPRTYKPFI